MIVENMMSVSAWRASYSEFVFFDEFAFAHPLIGRSTRVPRFAAAVWQFDVWPRLVCTLRGHCWRDYDYGDPEVGPCPSVACERCGRPA